MRESDDVAGGTVGAARYGRRVAEVQVRSKVPGGGALDVWVDVAGTVLTAAELVRLAVTEQVRALDGDAARGREVLDRQYLSDAEIREQAATGAIRPPAVPPPAPDPAREAARACQAFRQNVFAIFVGGRQVQDLDEQVTLGRGSRVVFLRLTPLAGG
jgi:hypothetical protein